MMPAEQSNSFKPPNIESASTTKPSQDSKEASKERFRDRQLDTKIAIVLSNAGN